MSEIGFYHLTRTGTDEALPALLGRTLDSGERALVRCADAERVAALDAALWLCQHPMWLPHGTAAMGQAAHQPIWLTEHDENPNEARFLFLIDGAESGMTGDFARVFDLFDGNDEAALAAARQRWKAAKAAGHALSYWQQGPRGWQKAEI
ncbi:MAG TPA: DNA polymerase III subunit chi [Acetobacteraceae bacterium]|nr:DNA polymerase III subunit chi [Acetobacteraceae bacterium]